MRELKIEFNQGGKIMQKMKYFEEVSITEKLAASHNEIKDTVFCRPGFDHIACFWLLSFWIKIP